MKKYAVKLYSYQLDCDIVKAVCSTKEKAFEMTTTLFNMLVGWLPEEATDVSFRISDEGWRRCVDFRPKENTTVKAFVGVPRAQVEIYCLEFEEDALSSESVKKENFFEEGGK